MKKMTKLLLINWHYFSKELVEFDSINFLTGKNKSGKSTIIDALQVVLMGETRGSSFNRAANKKSDRSLKSYLIGSMGEDIVDGKKSLRGGKDFTSYIVAELFDDVKAEFFCLGASFDSFADGSDVRKRFFWLKSSIPHEQFIQNNRPMNTRDLKIYLDTNFKNKSQTKDTNDAYQKLLLAKLNIHDPRMFSMMKSAISFEPINNIEKFITDNVCHIEEDINIEDMQQNIAYYKKQEQLAQSFSEKLISLEKIGQLYSELESLRSTRKIQNYLIQRAQNQNFADSLEETKLKAKQYENDIAEFQEQYRSIENLIVNLKEKERKLQEDIGKYRLDHNIDTLQDEIKKLKCEIDDITQSVKRFITDLRTNTVRWQEIIDNAITKLEQQDYGDIVQVFKDVKGALKRLEGINEDELSKLSVLYFSKLRDNFILARDKLDPLAKLSEKEKDKITAQTSTLKNEIEQLKKGIKSYPPSAQKLKKAISEALLKKYNKPISVSFLADLIDVSDDKWTNAVEGYLNTQRMYLVVDPEYFMETYRIYKDVRHKIENCEYRIIDCEKVYYATKNIVKGSLSQVVTADNKYAKAYIEYVLGRVTRCYDDSKIRENKTSITQSCMLYKNYTVGPINKWVYQTHYIGQKSIAQQIELKTNQLLEAIAMLKDSTIFCNAIVPVVKQEWFLTESYVQNSVTEKFTLLERKKNRLTELAEKEDLWEKIDLFWLDDMQNQVEKTAEELKEQYDKRQDTFSFIQSYTDEKNKTVMQTIPKLQEELLRTSEEVAQQYEKNYVLEIGEPRFLQEQQRLGNAKAVFERFEVSIKNTNTLIAKKEDEVRENRSEYNRKQNISFHANNVETNYEYQNEYEKIRDYELPAYRTRISKAKEDAMEQFKSDFLYRLKNNIETVMEKIDELNRALRSMNFENDTYRFEVKPNASMIEYYNLIMSSELQSGELDLFSYDFVQKYGSTIENLFSQIVDIPEDNMEKHSSKAAENIQIFSQYKTYLTFDLLVKDANGITKRLSESSGTNSGGEGQTPFYIATLASFAQLYKVNDYSEYGNTFRLVIFDEAFNKMDQERITESIKFLRELGLQAIVCAPPDKVADVAPLADKTWLVYKEERGGKCKSRVIEWTKEMGESIE